MRWCQQKYFYFAHLYSDMITFSETPDPNSKTWIHLENYEEGNVVFVGIEVNINVTFVDICTFVRVIIIKIYFNI